MENNQAVILINTLLDCIQKNMTDDMFREMKLRLRLPAQLMDADRLRFVETMEKYERLNEVEKYLRDRCPVCFPVAPPPPRPVAPTRIPFTNREREIRDILSPDAPAYSVVDAPAGYGKTELLQELARRFSDSGWVSAYISINEQNALSDVVHILAQQLNISKYFLDLKGHNLDLMDSFATALKQGRKDITDFGLAILIDLDKKPNLLLVRELITEFIPRLQENLRVMRFFSRPDTHGSRLRVVLAGRYLIAREERVREARNLNKITLSAFDYSIIAESAQNYLVEHEQSIMPDFSAHLLHLTAGHPEGIADVLKHYYDLAIPPDTYFDKFGKSIWTDIVRRTVDNVLDEIPEFFEGFRDLTKRLSVFRKFDYSLLKSLLQEHGHYHEDGQEYRLADQLVATSLFAWRDGFLSDAITRRLLALRFWQEHPREFRGSSEQACEICANRVRNPDTYKSEVWVFEYLFQSLQKHSLEIHDQSKRCELRQQFFEQEVPRILDLFTAGRSIQPLVWQKEIVEHRLKPILEKDWEFEFVVNYYLRDVRYTNEPFAQLRDKVMRYYSE